MAGQTEAARSHERCDMKSQSQREMPEQGNPEPEGNENDPGESATDKQTQREAIPLRMPSVSVLKTSSERDDL